MQITKPIGEQYPSRATHSKAKEWMLKFILMTILSLILGMTQGWAVARTYKPSYEAGFKAGVLHGVLMPAALPGLVIGQPLPIYAPNNSGNPYKIGYILGINACGTLFFGIAFWRRPNKKS